MTSLERFLDLVRRDASPGQVAGGASAEDVDALEGEGLKLPWAFRNWLLLCRGASVRTGTIFGVGNDDSSRDIISVLTLFPEWRTLGWIPLADDGFGNYYVADTSVEGAVGFVEVIDDVDVIKYYAASDVEIFLRELLLNEQDETGWPFDRTRAERVDPTLLGLSPLPWD